MSKKKKRSFNKVSAPGKKDIKKSVHESVDKLDASKDRGLTKGTIAMGAGLVAGTAIILAMGQSTKKGIDDVINDKQSVENLVDNGSEVKVTREKLEKYVPPLGSEINKKRFFPGVSKTVVFVPEVHKASTGVGRQDGRMEGLVNLIHAQKFDAVADLVKKFGKIPIVLEAWSKEDTGMDILDNPNFNNAVFQRLRSGGNLDSRLEMGRRLVAGSGVPAYVALLAIFGKDLSPVGAAFAYEQDKTDEAVDFARGYYNLVQSEKPVCKTGSGDYVNFEGMLNEIGRGNGESVMHCFCAVESLKEKMENVLDKREDVASLNEVKIASEQSDDLVIVSTGQLHNENATAYLDEKKTANYMVISPVALSKYLEISGFSRNKEGSEGGFETECKQLELSDPGIVQRTVREMLKLSN